MSDIRQTYKNRAEAYALLIQPGGYGVSRAKFYEDCARLRIVQPDKSLHLSDLLAYVKQELKASPVTGQSLGDVDQAREKEKEELRGLRLKNEKLEKENRKEDRRWMLRSEAEDHEAALVGLLRDTLRHLVRIQATSLLRTAGGSPSREPEFMQALLALVDHGFNELADAEEIEVEFAEESFEPKEAVEE